jgi:hypothetical protein
MCEQTGTSDPSVRNEHIVRMGVSSTGMKGVRERETCDRECIGNITYLLTPWSRVLLEKLTGLQLVKKFPAFYGTRRFITAHRK